MITMHGCCTAARTGHILIVLVPKIGGSAGARVPRVCVTLSVWTSVKKPKLATVPAVLDHCVALRIIQMERKFDSSTCDLFECTGTSVAWVVKPQSVVAVLDVEEFADNQDFCQVKLTANSLSMVDKMMSLGINAPGVPKVQKPHQTNKNYQNNPKQIPQT